MTDMSPIQRIYFGPPGSGKSHAAKVMANNLTDWNDDEDGNPNIIRTVFHPETTYGDFVAKLLPSTDRQGNIRYDVHAGPLVQAVAMAMKSPEQHVVLIIDEINRGPAAGIFGDIFQLLDRGTDGKSTYPIEVSELVVAAFATNNVAFTTGSQHAIVENDSKKLLLPANLSILATMNTSDESVHYMDAAFKRRWDWEFVKWDYGTTLPCHTVIEPAVPTQPGIYYKWQDWLDKLNKFIVYSSKKDLWLKRSVDDKLVGLHWLRGIKDPSTKWQVISRSDISDKLMHYLWDNVFARNRKPLEDLLCSGTTANNTSGQIAEAISLEPQQTIFFGPPGSGKSHAANDLAKKLVGAQKDKTHIIRTLFHPDTTYGDFICKLLPMSDAKGKVTYSTHIGPMLKAVILANTNPSDNVVLIIDEINRGHSAAVFGDFFQLLDRDESGASTYPVVLQKLCSDVLVDFAKDAQNAADKVCQAAREEPNKDIQMVAARAAREMASIENFRLPANLSILATMNTSDESVFYMDTAFKRRWGWKFVPWNDRATDSTLQAKHPIYNARLSYINLSKKAVNISWGDFLTNLNKWISSESLGTKNDDKLLGLWVGVYPSDFIKWMNHLEIWFKNLPSYSVKATEPNNNNFGRELNTFLTNCKYKVPAFKEIEWPKYGYVSDWKSAFPLEQSLILGYSGKRDLIPSTALNAVLTAARRLTNIDSSKAKMHISHFLWDNVFQRNRDPISKLLNDQTILDEGKLVDIRTYGDFLENWDLFVRAIIASTHNSNPAKPVELKIFGDFQVMSNEFIDAVWKL